MSKKHSKYEYSSSQSQRREDTLKATENKINKIKKYKPTELKGAEQNTYNNRLPKRPAMPKLPKLSSLKSTKVANPSGLEGEINNYKPKKLKVNKVYKNLPKKSAPTKPTTTKKASFNLPKIKTGALGVPSTKKAPGVTIKKKGKK